MTTRKRGRDSGPESPGTTQSATVDIAETIRRVETIDEHFEGRRRRAETRARSSGGLWERYFALVGVVGEREVFEYAPLLKLQPVEEPPGEIELAGALRQASLFGCIGRYSPEIKWELAVANPAGTEGFALNIGWAFTSLLRARTQRDFLVPAVADRSWSTIAAVTDGSCDALLIEDHPRAQRLTPELRLLKADLDWAVDRLPAFLSLKQMPAFMTAVDAITTHAHQTNLRTALAHLWTGIEALFGVKAELRFRVALYAASVLEPRGSSRVKLYERVKRMYDTRSKAVHGAKLSNAELQSHVLEARSLLGRLICAGLEAERTWDERSLDELVLSS